MAAASFSGFESVERVVAEDIRFKLRLGVGEDAYKTLKVGKLLQSFWDVGSVAASGAKFAASASVASTYFAGGGGFLSTLGFGAAATTPVGWVVAAAVASGGAYYGVMRMVRSYSGSRVQQIPAFINTPVDVLGVSLLDLMGTLAVKLAEIDGRYDVREREAIHTYFVKDWGFDPLYVSRALEVLAANTDRQSLKETTSALAEFKRSNPDCNYAAMHAELVRFLREIAEADGILDEREELAIEKIDAILAEAGGLKRTVRDTITAPGRAAAWAAGFVRSKLGKPPAASTADE